MNTDKDRASKARSRNKQPAQVKASAKFVAAHPFYSQHRSIKQRCYNPKSPEFKYYGAKGVELYAPWHKLLVFETELPALIGPRPSKKHDLDRIDSNGNYEPGNIQWLTRSENMRKAITKLSCPFGHVYPIPGKGKNLQCLECPPKKTEAELRLQRNVAICVAKIRGESVQSLSRRFQLSNYTIRRNILNSSKLRNLAKQQIKERTEQINQINKDYCLV